MVSFFLNIVEITIGVTVLSLILLLAMRLWGGKFTAKCRYILWMLVVIRLAVPVSFNLLPAVIEVPLQPVLTEQEMYMQQELIMLGT